MNWFQKMSARAKLLLAFATVSVILGGVAAFALPAGIGGRNRYRAGYDGMPATCRGIHERLRGPGKTRFRSAGIRARDVGKRSGGHQGIDEQNREVRGRLPRGLQLPGGDARHSRRQNGIDHGSHGDLPPIWTTCREAIQLHSQGKQEQAKPLIEKAARIGEKGDVDIDELVRMKKAPGQHDGGTAQRLPHRRFRCPGHQHGRRSVAGSRLVDLPLVHQGASSRFRRLPTTWPRPRSNWPRRPKRLSSGAQEQASSLEETASSLEEMTATVQQNAENAKQANQLAGNSRSVAEKGGEVVGRVVQEHGRDQRRLEEDRGHHQRDRRHRVPDQHIGVERRGRSGACRRAGPRFCGGGGEVRNLAQRSAAAAKEIKALISDSVDKVDAGTKQVDQAGPPWTRSSPR